MAKWSEHKRYQWLVTHWLLPKEARHFANLTTMADPTLRLILQDREIRRDRFEKLAARMVSTGEWDRTSLHGRWLLNISKMYRKNHWRVESEPIGGQQYIGPVGSPNPWALFRAYEKITPDRRHISPWQLRRHFGTTKLERGLLFIQRAERRGGTTAATVGRWLREKETAIKSARGSRRSQLIIERHRLERLLAKSQS